MPDDETVAQLPAPQPLRRGQSLFLDFDGTLVEIAAAPGEVWVSRELPKLLAGLAAVLDGAVALRRRLLRWPRERARQCEESSRRPGTNSSASR